MRLCSDTDAEHWGHQSTQLYYNNLKHADVPHTLDNGIHRKRFPSCPNDPVPCRANKPRKKTDWTERGGIVARGVLLDYLSWATSNGKSYKATDRHEITVDDLDAIAKEQNVTLRPGDILIVRSGMVKWYNEANEAERDAGVTNGHTYVGVEGTEKTVRWLWDHHFAAIAGDAIAFEAWPPSGDFSGFFFSSSPKVWRTDLLFVLVIHDWSLSMWGEPIGELWDLEALSEECKRQKVCWDCVDRTSLVVDRTCIDG